MEREAPATSSWRIYADSVTHPAAQSAGGRNKPYVQVAEIEVDPVQLDNPRAAVQEQIDTAIRRGARRSRALCAICQKDNPNPRQGLRGVPRQGVFEAHI